METEQALEQALEDARWLFSGMIYGFRVDWTPSWQVREIEDEFSLEPVAWIPRGEARFRTVSIHYEERQVFFLFEYDADNSQSVRRRGWLSPAHPPVAGAGFAAGGNDVRREAVEAAVREALRGYLRRRVYNRPGKVTGTVALVEFPGFGIFAGRVRATVELRLKLEELQAYKVD